ncbi:sigma-70 family RNA polymerase sigma factor [Sphingobacterium sp. PCS056]|uniref:RNA polymerase sigma factor n=1 Tax=Sphingobacterium sp. PCS056 TaxID=2931400 RepID=UPI00200BFD12|nr:sigma-70 family RNA polymerase sigma factor [Sphingobacterium sp. PCS056]UPZ37984.1 sigma-70 family RNA polymerase sigma factor [Sphingobacterium sp. PCS056]
MITNKPLNDTALLFDLKNGSVKAFDEIYGRYKRPITINLFALLKDRDLVEETLQELFCRLWEKRGNIDPQQSVQAYLYRIAGNLVNDHFRNIAKNRRLAARFWEVIQAQTQSQPEADIQKAMDEALFRTIEQLPPQCQRVFKLCKIEGKSYEEVSTILGISVSAVKDNIIRANRFLHAHYSYEAVTAVFLVTSYVLKDLN